MTRFGNEPLLRALTHTLGEGSTLYGSHPKRHLGGTPVLLMNRMNNSTHALFDLIMSMNSAVHRLFMSMNSQDHLIIHVGDGHRSTNTLHGWHEQ